jgi:hypothetical protein
LAGVVEATLDRIALGDDVRFEVILAFGTSPQGQVSFNALIVLTLPSPILGQHHVSFAQIAAIGVSDEQIEQTVIGVLETARRQQSDALRQAKPDS